MRYLKPYKLFEKKESKNQSKAEKMIEDFKEKYETELDKNMSVEQIELIERAYKFYKQKWIKGKVDIIKLKDLGGVHGRWRDTPKLKQMTLNPSIFKFKRKIDGNDDIPYGLFTIVHEIAHCVDHQLKVSFSREWKAISGWKKLDRRANVPEGYARYEEKRPGRKIAGHKLSNWIHKEDSDFIRKYTSRNPREDFADSLAYGALGLWHKFKGEGGEKKMEIIKKILKKVD